MQTPAFAPPRHRAHFSVRDRTHDTAHARRMSAHDRRPNPEHDPAWKNAAPHGRWPPVNPMWPNGNGSSTDEKHRHGSSGLPTPALAERASFLTTALSFAQEKLFSSSPSSRWRSPSPSPARTAATSSISSMFDASTIRFVLLCALWYTTSALSSNTGKAILNLFRFPVTLTIVQFAFIAMYCLLLANPWYGTTKLRKPTRAILSTTLPMAAFQVVGHVFSSMAISRIPVSTVHTIKALSPLFTVAAYAVLFGVKYTAKTYISLLPLTLGVMLACSFDISASNVLGLLCAFGSAVVFVSSNIFFKKIMPSTNSGSGANGGGAAAQHKLDKLNLLFYSSGLAFLLMIPIWMTSDLPKLSARWSSESTTAAPAAHAKAGSHGVLYYFFANGTVHFAQNIIAFAILGSTSPVTYSIASLIKRIAVICIAIVWFAQRVHPVQAFGIGMTFVGLWMYNEAKGDVERGENRVRRIEARKEMVLPSTKAEQKVLEGVSPSPTPSPSPSHYPLSSYPVAQTGHAPYSPYSISSSVARSPVHASSMHHALPPVNTSLPYTSHTTYTPYAPYAQKAKGKEGRDELAQSYPSPPLSNDDSPSRSGAGSPVSFAPPLSASGKKLYNRRGTVSGVYPGVGGAEPVPVVAVAAPS